MEMHKHKAIGSAQSTMRNRWWRRKKTSSLEKEASKMKQLHENLEQFKRKLERMKKIEDGERGADCQEENVQRNNPDGGCAG